MGHLSAAAGFSISARQERRKLVDVGSRSRKLFGLAVAGDDLRTMLRFFKYFRKKIGKKVAFLAQNKAKLCKILIITLVFEKNAIFLPKIVKNRRKL
jgi:hypothetical protein